MSQLTLASIPGFTDIDDAVLAANQPLTDDDMVKISQNAKFAAVRPEIISMGWYRHNDAVGLPSSPVDGYVYSREEILLEIVGFFSRTPGAGFVVGQLTRPPLGPGNAGPGNMYYFGCDVNDADGVVAIYTSYYIEGGAETPTNDGVVKVRAVCIRSSVEN
jgi:hypothetical protein